MSGEGDITLRRWADKIPFWEWADTPKARRPIELAAGFIRRRRDAAAIRPDGSFSWRRGAPSVNPAWL